MIKKDLIIPAALVLITSVSIVQAQTATDFDGNEYQSLTIGAQTWMKENLKSLHYSDGTAIEYVWSYNDSDSLAAIYGRLYSWESAMRGAASTNAIPSGVQGVCPNGWHMPGLAEWMILIDYCGGEFEAGAQLKEMDTLHWYSPNEGANNLTGFTALPGGSKENYGYSLMGESGFWWSTHDEDGYIYTVLMGKDVPYAISFGTYFQPGEINETGYSVRCLKNAGTVQISDPERKEQFNIYPDPANDWLIIEFENSSDRDLAIWGLDGKLMISRKLRQQENLIDISSLPEGIYIVSVRGSVGSFQKRIIKILTYCI